MKKAVLIFALTFSVMFSSSSYAEWTKVSTDANGRFYYVDFERIRKHGGYVYYWYLIDYLVPDEWGDLSSKVYARGDCRMLRFKGLSFAHHTQPMGKDAGETNSPGNPPWTYPPPETSAEHALKSVCDYSNK
jgi:hypothetical protein